MMIARALISLALGLGLATGMATAQQERVVLSHDTVTTVIEHCMAWGEERDLNLTIAVIDQGARLRGYISMDEAYAVSWSLAENKARSALALQQPTSALGWVEDVPGIARGADLIPLQGGVPVFTQDGVILGAVGVSGASSELDEQCAMAGVSAAGLVHGVVTNEAD